MKHVVITGVSTGIGRASAIYLAEHGFHVWGSVRHERDAGTIKEKLGDRFSALVFDVTDAPAIEEARDQVAAALEDGLLAGLVNNAGIAESGPLAHISLDDLRYQVEVNTIAPLAVTQAFLPLLGMNQESGRPRGRIVNISSVSGRRALPFLGPYAMSKFALEAQSDSLRRELMVYGVDVIVLQPGPIKTEIWEKAERIDMSKYENTGFIEHLKTYKAMALKEGRAGLPVDKVAESVHRALTTARPKTRYVITQNNLATKAISALVPDRWVDAVAARILGLKEQ